MMHLTRRQRRKLKRMIVNLVAGTGCGMAFGGMVLVGVMFDTYEPPSPPEHYGQIEYCGIWRDIDDHEAMMSEREEYLRAEQESEQAFYEAVMNIQTQQGIVAEPVSTSTIESMDWSDEEVYMLAKIAMAEAEGEDTEGKALVILTVLNRVWSDKFPDTIKEVIEQKNAFTSYRNGRYDRVEPNEDCYQALDMVQVEHWDESQGALYYERTTTENTWHNQNLKELFQHGNHTFYTEK